MKKQMFSQIFPFLCFSSCLVFLFALSKGGGNAGKGERKVEKWKRRKGENSNSPVPFGPSGKRNIKKENTTNWLKHNVPISTEQTTTCCFICSNHNINRRQAVTPAKLIIDWIACKTNQMIKMIKMLHSLKCAMNSILKSRSKKDNYSSNP